MFLYLPLTAETVTFILKKTSLPKCVYGGEPSPAERTAMIGGIYSCKSTLGVNIWLR